MYQNISLTRDDWTIHIWDDVKGYSSFKYRPYAYIKSKKGRFTAIDGSRVEKVTKFDRAEIHEGHLYEADVRPEIRTLVDMYANSDDVSSGHVIMNIDIEVEHENGFSTPEDADNEITAISWHDSITDEFVCLLLDKEGHLSNDISIENTTIQRCASEEELIYAFLTKYTEMQPTIITGWNIDNYDIPYLYNRMKKVVGTRYANLLSPIGKVEWQEFGRVRRYKIHGVSALDYMQLYKKYSYSEKSSYQLDVIGTTEVGMGKIKFDGSLDTLYRTDINKFVAYNVNDVAIVKKIDEKFKYIELAQTICHTCHVPYEDIFTTSNCLEGAILTYTKKNDIVVPCKKPKSTETKRKISGAYVKDPVRSKMLGRHEWVFDLDMTSLYPSIIMSLNISPETKVAKIKNWNSDAFHNRVDKVYELKFEHNKILKKLSTAELVSLLETEQYSVAANGTIYRTDVMGLIPALLSKWFEQRVHYNATAKSYSDKGDMEKFHYYDKRQLVQKILLNSMYGVLGNDGFRFYDTDNAEGVTTTGQQVIKYCAQKGNEYYATDTKQKKDYCIYIDTDSLFFSSKPLIANWQNLTNQQIIDLTLNKCKTVQDFINTSLNDYARIYHNITEHRFSLKQELIARSMFLVGKKRYAMSIINKKGRNVDELEVKGIDVVRSNFAAIFRQFMTNMLMRILDGESKTAIDAVVNNFKKHIETIPLTDIAKPTSVKNISKYESSGLSFKKGTPVHVKATLSYNYMLKFYDIGNQYASISNGSKIKWLYLKQNPLNLKTLAFKGYDDPPQIMSFIQQYIDYQKTFDADVDKKIQKFYIAMNWELVSNETAYEFFDFI